LDPQDPALVRDAAYDAWQASLTAPERESIVGLRVRWQWTFRHMQQAPDVQEFRIYYQPGRLNALLGNITAVTTPAGSSESTVVTDIPNAHPADSFVDTGLRVGPDTFRVLGSQAGTPLRLRVANIGPGDDIAPRVNAPCSVVIPERDSSDQPHPLHMDYDVPTNWQTRYYVVDFGQSVTETTDASGNPLRVYELFLPASGGTSLPLSPTLADPIVYAHVGVSSADDKTHTPDAAKWARTPWGDRPGNEGRVAGKVTLFRVRRERPPAPVPPPDAERVFATPADYHGNSHYTYRWQPSPHLKAHVYRALDDALFKVDWAHRVATCPPPEGNACPTIVAGDGHLYPVELRGPDPGLTLRRQQIAAEINQLNDFVGAAEGTEQAMTHYHGLSNDALRVLAGLPWTETAFTQITLRPLDSDDPQLANRPGPDNPPDFPIDPALRIYIDTLDGRSTNRYFYRSAYVDGAHNRSEHLSLSSPPVYLPNVVPPRTPVLTKVLGGDREIILKWASNREPDLAEYRVYVTDSRENARDLRLMNLIHSEVIPASDPDVRPAEMSWAHAPVGALVTHYYRIVAVDTESNVSQPSPPRSARAFHNTPPEPPEWTSVEWAEEGGSPVVLLRWMSDEPDLTCTLQRRPLSGGGWLAISPPLAPIAANAWEFTDRTVDISVSHEYRIQAIDEAGNSNLAYDIFLLPGSLI
jgi:hypothetical protein